MSHECRGVNSICKFIIYLHIGLTALLFRDSLSAELEGVAMCRLLLAVGLSMGQVFKLTIMLVFIDNAPYGRQGRRPFFVFVW